MEKYIINPAVISETKSDTFEFMSVPTMNEGFTDVFYKGDRIAIINGLSSTLQWTCIKGIDVPYKVIKELEDLVDIMIEKSNIFWFSGYTNEMFENNYED